MLKREKYVGVKFKTVFLGNFKPGQKEKESIKKLIQAGRALGKMGIKDKNGGNLSYRLKNDFIIKNTGSYPHQLKMKDFSLVKGVKKNKVFVFGQKEPSSESRLHFYLYQMIPSLKAIIHAHDFKVLNSPKKIKGIGYLKKEISYGTLESARAVTKMAKKFNYLVQKNHGVVALGKSIQGALNLIKKYHEKFIISKNQ